MKKIFVFLLIFISFLVCNAIVVQDKYQEVNETFNEKQEMKGIYISYLEYLTYFQGNSLTINRAYINKMLDNIKTLGLNTIFLQVSPFSDSIYNSKIFPYSYTLSGVEGKNPGMDYLDYFLTEAHKRGLKLHAWINPYRISSSNDIEKLSKVNPAYSLLNTNDVKVSNKGIYYNPASSKAIDLIVKQVYEIISNYNVDGIHLDDYFYVDQEIDQVNYLKYIEKNPNITLTDYRLNMVNTMIKNVYKTIKDYNSEIIFSIAPDGNINNNYDIHFADVKTWLLENDYVDIIMPQIYYGFENQYRPFNKALDEWVSLIKNDVKIIPVLAFYKVGTVDNQAGSGKNEWLENDNIINRQILTLQKQKKYEGFALFRYDFLFNENLANDKTKIELQNMKLTFNN